MFEFWEDNHDEIKKAIELWLSEKSKVGIVHKENTDYKTQEDDKDNDNNFMDSFQANSEDNA